MSMEFTPVELKPCQKCGSLPSVWQGRFSTRPRTRYAYLCRNVRIKEIPGRGYCDMDWDEHHFHPTDREARLAWNRYTERVPS